MMRYDGRKTKKCPRSSRMGTLAEKRHYVRLLAHELDPAGLVLALEGVHGVVILHQQRLDPTTVQIHSALALLLEQGLIHDRRQTLVTIPAQALEDVRQALLQALGEGLEALLGTVQGNEFVTQVDHVILENALDPARQAVFQPDQGELLHALVELQRQGTLADDAALILEHELLDARRTFFQDVDGQGVLEIDLRRLDRGALAEA